ncbi:MAG: ECF transporter S component, partial [Bacilli bacterium]|nr:ECF transporter S component [Bacilli bacterium]
MERSTRNEQIRSLIFASILIALILIMTFIPQLGYITINAIPITIIHIPVIVGGIFLGRKYGLVLGIVFGIGSLIRSFMEYSLHAPFTNPLLSVLPRA